MTRIYLSFCVLLVVLSFYVHFLSATRTAENDPKNYRPMKPIHSFRSEHDKFDSTYVSQFHKEMHILQEERYKALHYVEPHGGEAWWAPFDEADVSFPVAPEMAIRVKDKYVIGPRLMKNMQEKFIIYAAGIANEPDFEEAMGALNVSVHAFDCTIPANSQFRNVHFHHWCLGRESAFENNIYASHSSNKTFVFKSLSETKKLLGHQHVHILKMDIEGFEWDILRQDIINNENSADLPDQILVEIHTLGANPHFVPQHLTNDKGRAVVNELLLGLWKRGYRIVDRFINPSDRHCSDFTFLRVHN